MSSITSDIRCVQLCVRGARSIVRRSHMTGSSSHVACILHFPLYHQYRTITYMHQTLHLYRYVFTIGTGRPHICTSLYLYTGMYLPSVLDDHIYMHHPPSLYRYVFTISTGRQHIYAPASIFIQVCIYHQYRTITYMRQTLPLYRYVFTIGTGRPHIYAPASIFIQVCIYHQYWTTTYMHQPLCLYRYVFTINTGRSYICARLYLYTGNVFTINTERSHICARLYLYAGMYLPSIQGDHIYAPDSTFIQVLFPEGVSQYLKILFLPLYVRILYLWKLKNVGKQWFKFDMKRDLGELLCILRTFKAGLKYIHCSK